MNRRVSGLFLAVVTVLGAPAPRKARASTYSLGTMDMCSSIRPALRPYELRRSGKTMDRVLIYPKRTPVSKMDEKFYVEYGIMRVEVAPIGVYTPQGNFRAGLKELRTVIPETLRRAGSNLINSVVGGPLAQR